MAAAAAPAAAPLLPGDGPVHSHDHHGFLVKPEFSGLYTRFAPLYEAEERERSEKWAGLMVELAALVGRQPDEGDAALLQRALAHLTDTTASGAPPPQAAALLQRVASLVQAGLPMRSRGDFWRLFLNVDAKRQGKEAEYARLCAEVEQLEALAASNSAAAAPAIPPLPGAAKVAAASASQGGTYSLVADSTAAAAAAAAARLHRIDVFQVTALDESPEVTPAKQPSSSKCGKEGGGEEGAPGTAAAAQAVATPASTLLTPQAYSTASSSSCVGGSGGLPTAATPHTSGSVACAAADAECATGGSMHSGGVAGVAGSSPSSIARTAERWRQGEILSQIDKDLHRTFPGHPALDAGGRAMLRRILGAYARRNPAVGYCQGLNFLAATLMLWMAEEDAFWCLSAVIEDILGCSYFDERMVLPQVDVLVFGHLLQGRFPTLWRHLQALEVDAGSVTMHWFLCCFLNSLPLDSALRVWDLLFFEGSAVVLFRVALALIEIYDQALMCCRESSDGYMLLQSCAQMTYDGSRLVDTACIGYSHLQPAGLSVLRQRYRPAVLENLRASGAHWVQLWPGQGFSPMLGAFSAGGEYDEYVRSQQSSPESVGAAPPTFADAFQRVSSAALEAEEAAARAAQKAAADGGHLALRGRGASRRGSPGTGSGGSGSQPASPLARVRQAMSGLTSRLVPSSLPQLLPAGALDASGQELSPMSSGSSVGPSPLRAHPARRSSGAVADAPPAGQQQGAMQLRRISVGERQQGAADGSSSPGSSGSAGSGAVLRRQPLGLTPFGSADALLGGAGAESGSQQQGAQPAAASAVQQQQQQQQQQLGWTPPRPGAGRGAMPCGHGPAAVAQSQPATPSALLPPVHPPGTQRRAMTFGATGSGHTRRRRRLSIDLLSLANLRPDLHQPGVAAALAIAANPSPHAARAAGPGRAFEPDGSLAGSLQPSLRGARDDGSGGAEGPAAGGATDAAEDLLLPIRALRFDDADGIAVGDESGAGEDGTPTLHGPVRRAVTAPVWLPAAPAAPAAEQPSIGEELPVSSSAQRLSSGDELLSSGEEAAGMGGSRAAMRAQHGPATTAPAAVPATSAEEGQDSSSGAASSSPACADSSSTSSGGVIPAAWSPGGGGSTGAARPPRLSPVRGCGQSRQALLDVVAQLQGEVAVAESRRHEAEQAAEEAQQTVQDLRRQVDKVQALAASKEALIAELSAKLQASSASAAELGGELAAARMAVEGEEAELERARRQLGAADALVQRLMAAVAERGRTSPSKRPIGIAVSAAATATGPAPSSTTTSSCGSPQSSIGSVAPRAR